MIHAPVDAPKKHPSRKEPQKVASTSTDDQDKKIQQWTSEEEELLAKCFVAVFEDPNVERDQKLDCFWSKVVFDDDDNDDDDVLHVQELVAKGGGFGA
ncbi:hypothetical protein Tco_1175133 [Tanacetum coccineum]